MSATFALDGNKASGAQNTGSGAILVDDDTPPGIATPPGLGD